MKVRSFWGSMSRIHMRAIVMSGGIISAYTIAVSGDTDFSSTCGYGVGVGGEGEKRGW